MHVAAVPYPKFPSQFRERHFKPFPDLGERAGGMPSLLFIQDGLFKGSANLAFGQLLSLSAFKKANCATVGTEHGDTSYSEQTFAQTIPER